MEKSLWTFLSKISMVKPLYRAAKRRCEKFRSQRIQAELENKTTIIRQGSIECLEGMPLKVMWDITSFCKFRCSYCYNAGKGYKKDFCTIEQAETAIKHIASTNRPSYQVNLIGGEPTTHPHLDKIVKLLCHHLGDRLEMLQITSNGSFGESQMEAILKASEQVRVNLLVSVHLEYMDVERVVELVKRYSSRTRLQIALMFHPELVEKAMAVADALCDLRKDYVIYMIVSELREPPDYNEIDRRYTQEHLNCKKRITDKFNKIREEGPKRHENPQQYFFVEQNVNDSIVIEPRVPMHKLEKMTGCSFTGLTCCAGTNYVRILVDGSVRGIDCDLDKPICNIFEENPFLREDWMHGVLCTMNRCGCNQNYRIPKFRSPADAQRLIAEKKLEQKKLMSAEEKI